jgi:hypothetical protein
MKTLKLRIKDKHAKVLIQLASEVNFVCNDLGHKHLQRTGKLFSICDIAVLLEESPSHFVLRCRQSSALALLRLGRMSTWCCLTRNTQHHEKRHAHHMLLG